MNLNYRVQSRYAGLAGADGNFQVAGAWSLRQALGVAQIPECGIEVFRWQIMTETVVLGESGRIVLPAAIRNEFGLKAGDRLTVFSEAGSIRIMSRDMALKSIQADIIKHRGSLTGLLDEFLEERRQEAAREFEESVVDQGRARRLGRVGKTSQ